MNPKTTNESLALLPVRMRDARELRGLSQRALARISGIGEKTISSYETGERIKSIKLSHVLALADAIGVSVRELLPEVR